MSDKEIHIKFENGSEIETIPCDDSVKNTRSKRGNILSKQFNGEVYVRTDLNEEHFKKEYSSKWLPTEEYKEAYKLWLWYYYHTELYDSEVCTGSNEYEEYMPRTYEEKWLINENAIRCMNYINHKRMKLKKQGICISEDDWQSAKRHFARYKLKALEEKYKHYFGGNKVD